MLRDILTILILFIPQSCESDRQGKTDATSGKEIYSGEPAILKVNASMFSFLILDSIPMGKITHGSEYRLLPGTHRIQIHNIDCEHFDTSITLKSGTFSFTKLFPEREGYRPINHGRKKKK
jgi:hypothetical protein